MAEPLDPVTVTAGAAVAVDLSQYSNGKTILGCKITNESNLAVKVGGIIPGGEWLAGFTENLWRGTQNAPLGRQLVLTGQSISNAVASPSTVCLITLYFYGDHDLPSGTWPLSLARLTNVGNNLSITASAANTLEQDLFGPFVLYGLAPSKDSSVANQLDVTNGVAFLRQSDQSLGRVSSASQTFTTSTPSATYYLYLQPDGTWYWSSSNAPLTNSIEIALVTTDGSGNISAITDSRTLDPTLLPQLLDGLIATFTQLRGRSTGSTVKVGEASWIDFVIGSGVLTHLLGIGAEPASQSKNVIDASGILHNMSSIGHVGGVATAGALGAPAVVATTGTSPVHVTSTAVVVVFNYTGTATKGLYKVTMYVNLGNGTSGNTIILYVSFKDPASGTTQTRHFPLDTGQIANGSTSIANGCYATAALLIYADSTAIIQVGYQDPTNTPNDYVSATIEQVG